MQRNSFDLNFIFLSFKANHHEWISQKPQTFRKFFLTSMNINKKIDFWMFHQRFLEIVILRFYLSVVNGILDSCYAHKNVNKYFFLGILNIFGLKSIHTKIKFLVWLLNVPKNINENFKNISEKSASMRKREEHLLVKFKIKSGL